MTDQAQPMAAAQRAEAPALDVQAVSKTFRIGRRTVQALLGVDLQVLHGQVTGLIGPDGAGKTTLMRLAAGLLVPDRGRILALEMDVVRQSREVQAAIGYMPQRFGLYEDLSVRENLDLYADLQGVVPGDRPQRYAELMRMTGLEAFQSRLAGRLSGGMKQKLGLACTLLRTPRLLMLDEATVGVDPLSRRELWAIIFRLVADAGVGVLLSTAYLDEAERCQQVALLHEGRLLGYGPPREFSRRLEGRTFSLAVRGPHKRRVQAALARAPGVVDAVIQTDQVRLVMTTPSPPDVRHLLPDLPAVVPEAVPPRFEDSFIAQLRGDRPSPGAKATGLPLEKPLAVVPGADRKVIDVQELQRRFGKFYAVRGVTFHVDRGEVFGLLGANGAGKSTTFRMLCGLLPPSAGRLKVAGVDLRRSAPAARARIGYMAQKFSLYGNLSVQQNLRFFSRAYGLTGQRRARRIEAALEQFELASRADMNSGDLPLGYKQRLALACALMHAPDILFLDEPTSGVDPLARREFWHRINAQAERGVTVLVTTHFMEEAEYCDRLAIMAAGEILALGTPDEIRSLARSSQQPEPTMEDAFIHLIENAAAGDQAA